MIKIVIYTIWVRSHLIEPRIVRTCAAMTEIHLCQCAGTGKVVVHDIKEHCDASAMTFINEFLVHLAGSVILVQSEI